jgi:hypothetical protein
MGKHILMSDLATISTTLELSLRFLLLSTLLNTTLKCDSLPNWKVTNFPVTTLYFGSRFHHAVRFLGIHAFEIPVIV